MRPLVPFPLPTHHHRHNNKGVDHLYLLPSCLVLAPHLCSGLVCPGISEASTRQSKPQRCPPSLLHSHRQYSTSTRHYHHCSRCTFSTTGPARNRIGKQQHHGAPAAGGSARGGGAGGAEQPMPKEEKMTSTKKSLSVLVLCTFCTLLAALEVGGVGAACVWCDAWSRLKARGGLKPPCSVHSPSLGHSVHTHMAQLFARA